MSQGRFARRRRHDRAPSGARPALSWLVALALVLQAFLTTAHIHLDRAGLSGLTPTQSAFAGPHRHALAAAQAGEAEHGRLHAVAGHESDGGAGDPRGHFKHVDCQVCQTTPLVSAALAATGPALMPAILPGGPVVVASRVSVRPLSPLLRPRSRAPPLPL